MKRFAIILMLGIAISYSNNCNAQKKAKENTATERKLTRAQIKQIRAQNIKECIKKDSLHIVVDRINPMGSTAQSSSDGYHLKLQHGKVSMYLPYMGNSTSPIMGGQRLSIETSGQPVNIQKERDDKNECTYYLFYFTNDNRKDKWECVFQVYDNGYTLLKLSSPGMDSVGFQGKLNTD